MDDLNKNLTMSRLCATGLVFAGALGVEIPAAIGQELMLEEVVVTARRREESLQETPVAVSAFGEDEMRAAQITGVADLTAHVPGLARREGRKEADLSIRGVGQRVRGANADPAVGVYVDNIFIPRSDAQLLDAINLQSIQVLRGPQGTLFGKNTAGGALLLTTKKPGDEYEGFATGNFGDLSRTRLRFGSSGPLTDQLSAGIVVDYAKEDGYRDDAETGIDYGDTNRRAVLGQFGYAGDTFGADLMLFWGDRKEQFAPVNCFLSSQSGALQSFTAPGDDRDYRDVCQLSESLADDEKVLMDRQGSPWEMSNYIAGLTLHWDFGDIQFKSITGYLYQDDIIQGGEVDATPVFVINSRTEANRQLDALGFDTENEERTFYSQEFQLVGSALDEDFTYTVGLFASEEEIDDAPGGGMIGPGGYLGRVDVDTGLIRATPLVRNLEVSSYDNESWALFGQGIYSISDNWQLTLGLRYTEETKKANQFNYESNAPVLEDLTRTEFDALVSAIQPIVIAPLTRNESESWEVWTPAVTITHFLPESLSGDVLESGMLYFSVSEGFKAGGFTPFGEEFLPFDPEEILSYELGAKLDLFERTLRINTSIYYSEYDDIQLRVTRTIEDDSEVGTTTLDGIINAAQATMTGAEIEATWLPTNNLMFIATGAWIDAQYDEFIDQAGEDVLVDRSDEDLAYIPETTWSLTAQYTCDTDFGEISPRISGFYTDEVFIGLDAAAANEEIAYLDDYLLWSFRLALKPEAIENLEVAAYVNNLTDKSYFGTGLISTGGVGAAGLIPGKQRTWGVEMAYSW